MKAVAIVTLVFLAGAPAWSQTSDDLRNDGRNTDYVLTYGMGYSQNRYSTLNEINKHSVKRLVPVWNVSLASNDGEQAQPRVHDGVALMPE